MLNSHPLVIFVTAKPSQTATAQKGRVLGVCFKAPADKEPLDKDIYPDSDASGYLSRYDNKQIDMCRVAGAKLR